MLTPNSVATSARAARGVDTTRESPDMERFPLSFFSDGDIELDDEFDVEDAFGEHGIEYWVCASNRFVPATAEQIAAIREYEALDRLGRWKRLEARRNQGTARAKRHVRRLARRVARFSWLAALVRHMFARSGRGARTATVITSDQRADTGATPTDAGGVR